MLVGVDQVARVHRHAPDVGRPANLDQVDVGVRHQHTGREELEPQLSYLIEIAHPAVRHGADAAEGLVDVAVHLSPEGANGVRGI